MFSTLKTLFAGAQARADETITDHFALDLIDQKIRESENALKAAKATLASLIQRQRSEERQVDTLKSRIDSMMNRAAEALDADDETLATEAANAIAQMETELAMRTDTLDRLEQKVLRMKSSIEAGNRRIIDLKQGAIQARAVRREQDIQKRMNKTLSGSDAASEAEDLIARVLKRDDPFEQAEILKSIEEDLNHDTLENRMADAGYGPATRITAKSVLERLKASKSAA
ncbi:PspA/IM30 family protein [Alisedimentitalea sp. MJ-SS2]|uniref:PspA/IM30 family protein n=1 Tax=Aliisedimentitalea sp. MJ-SS2 TaxID=3049795 RepID=UPI00290B5817|nr:PspA/IM30 family protein [Alisedimentitalea sp. MJ-SS2]MDU8925962.1 PspA/IM30 family protein [Alisedimentitalea sp. MJ-SS2]